MTDSLIPVHTRKMLKTQFHLAHFDKPITTDSASIPSHIIERPALAPVLDDSVPRKPEKFLVDYANSVVNPSKLAREQRVQEEQRPVLVYEEIGGADVVDPLKFYGKKQTSISATVDKSPGCPEHEIPNYAFMIYDVSTLYKLITFCRKRGTLSEWCLSPVTFSLSHNIKSSCRSLS